MHDMFYVRLNIDLILGNGASFALTHAKLLVLREVYSGLARLLKNAKFTFGPKTWEIVEVFHV